MARQGDYVTVGGRRAILCVPARQGDALSQALVRFVDGARERVLIDPFLIEEAEPVDVEAAALPGKLQDLAEDLDG